MVPCCCGLSLGNPQYASSSFARHLHLMVPMTPAWSRLASSALSMSKFVHISLCCHTTALNVFQDYKAALAAQDKLDEKRGADEDGERPRKRARRDGDQGGSTMEPKVQGSLLLRSLLLLSSPHNETVLVRHVSRLRFLVHRD